MNKSDQEHLALWVEKQLDDSLEPKDLDQLQQKLMLQPEARDLYLDLMHQNAHLQLERVHLSAFGIGSAVSVDESPEPRARPERRIGWLPAMIALAASLLPAVWWSLSSSNPPRNTLIVAQIVDSSDAEWGDCTLPTAIGSSLGSGRLKIERGLTTIRFASGAEVTLESPAELEIQSSLRGRLLAGTAVVEVPESAHGFTLSTPTAVAIDHGTAFAVTIDDLSQSSTIEDLDGVVEVQHVGSDASRHLRQKQRVIASTGGLSESEMHSGEAELAGSEPSELALAGRNRITTADRRGRDASISRATESIDSLENSEELFFAASVSLPSPTPHTVLVSRTNSIVT